MLTEELRKHLTGTILPYWENLADPENGGFFGYVDYDLHADKTAHKGCILNSRILWSFSTAARVLKDKSCLPYADRAFSFMEHFMDRDAGGVFWSVTPEGKPLDTTKHTYCQAFAIYGLAAYYMATGKQEALDRAMDLFRVIEDKCTDEGGYGEAYKADFSPESNEKLSENGVMAGRTMNTLLHVLEGYAELYKACHDEQVRKAGVICLERFLKVMYSPENHRLEVFYDRDYHSLLNMQSYGHDVEGSWLIWDAVVTLLPEGERAPYRAMCADLAESVYQRALTDHGFENEVVDGDVNHIRVWWVQAESVLGMKNAYDLTGDKKYMDAALRQWKYIQEKIVDHRPGGEWYWSLYEDGTPTGKPEVEEWKCPYHNSRMCLRLIEQGDC